MKKLSGPQKFSHKCTYSEEDEDGTVLSEIELTLHLYFWPESGDGWNEPVEPAHVEYLCFTNNDSLAAWYSDRERAMVISMLDDWAETYVDDNQGELVAEFWDLWEGAREAAADMAREARREAL